MTEITKIEWSDEQRDAFYERWTEALRSDEFEQGDSVLEQGGKFCCLGVACYMLAQDGILERDTEGLGVSYNDHSSYLPEIAQELLGMTDDGRFGTEFDTLAALNDSGHSFPAIADIIEREYERGSFQTYQNEE